MMSDEFMNSRRNLILTQRHQEDAKIANNIYFIINSLHSLLKYFAPLRLVSSIFIARMKTASLIIKSIGQRPMDNVEPPLSGCKTFFQKHRATPYG